MKITKIRELSVALDGLSQVSNAVVNFSGHTASLVAVFTDVMRQGKPLVGLGFNSIGRFAQGGILRERMVPRVLDTPPEKLLSANGRTIDPGKVLAAAMRNEKPGGHGDRAGAAGALELAIWDLMGKIEDEPAYASIARAHGRSGAKRSVDVYAAGGYYYGPDQKQTLSDELRSYQAKGYSAFKMKIGGAPLAEDLRRIEEALAIAGDGSRLAVDANGRFDLRTALSYAQALEPYRLRWFEEIGDPLDFALNAEVAQAYAGAVATGENLFSAPDVRNLLNFGGMRPGRDIFQMDPGLCYGLTEFARMLDMLDQRGFRREQVYPHGGHLINLHIVVGLGLGGTESYPYALSFQPFAGYSDDCRVEGSSVTPGDAPGFGLERKRELQPFISKLLD